MFKEYKVLKEIENKTEELKRLMKILYECESKYLEDLYKYNDYENKQLLESNIKSKEILKEFINELKKII